MLFLNSLWSLASSLFVACAILGLITVLATAIFIKSIIRLHDHFTFRWAYTTKEGRLIQVFSCRRNVKTLPKLLKWLKWFGLRLINDNDTVSLLEDKDCPEGVLGYDPISKKWLQTVHLPGGVKTIDRSKVDLEILPDVTLIGTTKINARLHMGPIPIPQKQAVAQ